jgi:hypothetical protein
LLLLGFERSGRLELGWWDVADAAVPFTLASEPDQGLVDANPVLCDRADSRLFPGVEPSSPEHRQTHQREGPESEIIHVVFIRRGALLGTSVLDRTTKARKTTHEP